ncbi:MAG: hypothetical protein KC476_10630 [Cyanobacteria bacterium HKST-UBA06]|nr:hypothetical protein [Cyanobacteria bacterium HKST-UBA06]
MIPMLARLFGTASSVPTGPAAPISDLKVLMHPTLNFMVMVLLQIHRHQTHYQTSLIDVGQLKVWLTTELDGQLPAHLKPDTTDQLLHQLITTYRAVAQWIR